MVRRNPNCELIAVCDIAPKEKLGLESLNEKFYSTPEDLLKNHPEIELLQHKHFIAIHHLKDEDVLNKNFPVYISKVFKAMLPLNLFLRNCMP